VNAFAGVRLAHNLCIGGLLAATITGRRTSCLRRRWPGQPPSPTSLRSPPPVFPAPA